MPPPPLGTLTTTLTTTIALVDQFIHSLSPDATNNSPESPPGTPSSLLLLDAAAKSLKSQVTKISLLTVTTPFTSDAIATCLRPLNESVLPSLVTATLLTTPDAFLSSFSHECNTLTRGVLRDFSTLLRLVDVRSKDNKPKAELSSSQKEQISAATGRVWESCDALSNLATEDISGFVVRKAKQWLDLMKDAVTELQEWDPEEEVDEDPFGDAISDDEIEQQAETQGAEKASNDRAVISAGVKDQVLKVLSRIPQSVHVVSKQRLEKLRLRSGGNLSKSTSSRLDQLLLRIRNVSELIDESAEAMYLGNPELCLKKAGEARAVTIEIVEAVLKPLDDSGQNAEAVETAEDKYVKRALDWIRQVEMKDTKTKVPP